MLIFKAARSYAFGRRHTFYFLFTYMWLCARHSQAQSIFTAKYSTKDLFGSSLGNFQHLFLWQARKLQQFNKDIEKSKEFGYCVADNITWNQINCQSRKAGKMWYIVGIILSLVITIIGHSKLQCLRLNETWKTW